MGFKFRVLSCCLISVLGISGGSAAAQTADAGLSAPGRVKVSESVASSLISQKIPPKDPDAARDAGIQGTVVLKVVLGESGDVKEVTTVSGDPTLAQAAADAVKQWKYQP